MKRIVTAFLFLLGSQGAVAYTFTLSPSEWGTWPEYCKSKYVVTGTGSRTRYRGLVSGETIKKWQALIGHETWPNIHHGCAGMIWILRAERLEGRDEVQYQYSLNRAWAEATYSHLRTPPAHPFYTKMAIVMARVEYGRGHRAKAIAALKQIVDAAPELADTYSVLGLYLYREKKFDDARAILERGIEILPDPTAEMHYFLGLVLLRQQAYDEAREHAHEAYNRGYPLPGLRNKLKSAGHWDT